jgi:hypothetical protein
LSKNDLDKNDKIKPSRKTENGPFGSGGSMRWMGYGIEFLGVIGLFAGAGYWADQKLAHRIPWMMLTGFGMAFVGMVYLLWKETANLRK